MKERSILDGLAWTLLCVFVFTLPLEKAIEMPGIGTIARAVGLAAFAAGAAAAAGRRALRKPNSVLVLAAAFVLWSALTWFWTVSSGYTAARIATLAQLLAMAWLIWEMCRTPARQDWLLRAYVAGAAVSSVLTIARYALRQQTYYRRYATAGFEPNDLAVTLALSLPMALYLGMRTRGMEAWLIRLSAALAIGGVLLTASRTGLVAAALAFLFPAITWRSAALSQRISAASLLGLLILGTIWLAPSQSRERLATLTTELSRGTFHGRTRIWKTGLKAFKPHWFAGVGAGAYPEAVRPWLGKPTVPGHEYVAHNTFLSVLVETGIVGFAIFGLMMTLLVVFTWMLAAADRALWFTSLAVWAAGVSTLTWENRKPTWLLFALIMTAWGYAFRPREDGA